MYKMKKLNLSDDQIEEIIRQYSLINKDELKEREHGSDGYSKRDEYHRDYARILYSPSFRRLQGKMQIMGIKSDAFYRNRLTHSLEVAQIARSIAALLSETCEDKCKGMYKDDIYVLEAAALAHDIGHPAFGHKGEKVLNDIAKNSGMRFEGNAQNYRVLRKLEIKDSEWQGLNLTYRTLLAINKYIISERAKQEKIMYEEDYKFLNNVRKKNGLSQQRTLDVQIIEIADDIAYAVHDLEDGLSLRKFNVDEILFLLKEGEMKNKNNSSKCLKSFLWHCPSKVEEKEMERLPSELFKDIVENAKEYANKKSHYSTNIQEYSKIFRVKLTSLLTNEFVHDIILGEVSKEEAKLHGTKEGAFELSLNKYRRLLNLLKKSVFVCSTRDTDIQEYEKKGEVIINTLYNIYSDSKKNKDGMLLPPNYRRDVGLRENSINYISGMMDTFAISMFEELTGVEFNKIDFSKMR